MMKYACLFSVVLTLASCVTLLQAKDDDVKTTKAGGDMPFTITTKKPDDQVKAKIEKDTVFFDVFCPSGIGKATITLTKGDWAKTVIVRFHLGGLESFSISNGKITFKGEVSSTVGHKKTQSLIENDQEKSTEPAIKVFDAEGKPAAGLPGKGGCFEITLPKALTEKQPKTLTVEWIDFWRR